MRRRCMAFAFLILCLAETAADGAEQRSVSLRVEPGELWADLFYSGAEVRVEGIVPRGLDVAIVCRGKEQSLEMKRKGKVLGLLWMNTGEITFHHLPSMYLLESSAPLSRMGSVEELRRLGLGYNALESAVFLGQDREEQRRFFGELVKLREKEGLFRLQESAVQSEEQTAQTSRFSASCQFPARAPMGEYEVQLIGFSRGQGELLASRRLSLQQAGLVHLISSLAERRGLLFGLVVVLIAIAAGLLTGLVFGIGGKGH
jgi:uncharacterized protein (TIGR02186 family)